MIGGRTALRGPIRFAAGIACAAAVGCTNHRSAVPPEPVPPPAFSVAGEQTQPNRWWTAFGDAALTHQVGLAFAGNYTIDAALARVAAAEALARREASDLFPDVDGVIDIDRTYRTRRRNARQSLFGLIGSYPVDLWGEIEARIEGQELRAAATFEEYQAAALTLSADVAAAWLSLIEANAQLALLEEQIESNERGLEIQEARFGLGQVRAADVLRQRQLLESTREQVAIVQTRVETLQHLLAVLQGRPPQGADDDPGTAFPELPPLPETGLPCDLLRRRPDVRRDFLALQAADRDFAAAISQQYPRLNITASLRTAAVSPERAFREYLLSIGGQLIGPIIDGGQRRAEVARTEAVVQTRFNEYVQTTLAAFGEVEDALARERLLRQRIERLESQFELAQRSSVRLREQYLIDADEVDFLSVLSATIDAQRLQRTTLAVKLDLLLNRVELYRALAGGVDVQAVATAALAPPALRPAIEPVDLPEPDPVRDADDEEDDDKDKAGDDGDDGDDGEDDSDDGSDADLRDRDAESGLPDAVPQADGDKTLRDLIEGEDRDRDDDDRSPFDLRLLPDPDAAAGRVELDLTAAFDAERDGWQATPIPVDRTPWAGEASRSDGADWDRAIPATFEPAAVDDGPDEPAWWRSADAGHSDEGDIE